MAERHIYGSDNKYRGNMDDDGRIYDANHRFIGRVKFAPNSRPVGMLHMSVTRPPESTCPRGMLQSS